MTDRDDLQQADRLIHDTLPVLAIQSAQGVYPYMVTDGSVLQIGRGSMTTNAMVCHTISALLGYLPHSAVAALCARVSPSDPMGEKLASCLRRAIPVMASDVARRGAASDDPPGGWEPSQVFRSRSRPEQGPFDSSTFGAKDPFTIAWLVELFRVASNSTQLCDPDMAATALRVTEKTALARAADILADPAEPTLKSVRREERMIVHPLPLIRTVQLARLTGAGDERQFAKVANWFLNLLHLQLSLRGIEHGDFDPAELVFAFEGLLETAPLRVTAPIVRSFVSCLDAGRQVDPTFRALNPFKATESGSVHLFSSIEVCASLLRSATKRAESGDTEFFEMIKPALHDYLQWLQATVVTGRAIRPTGPDAKDYADDTPVQYVGWQSEFAHTGDLSAHIWLTSQVIMFLSGYKVLIQASIARAEVARVGLIPEYHHEDTEALSTKERLQQARKQDPLQLDSSSVYRVSSRLEELFVGPRLDNRVSDVSYSCLLYGPPGTGKTTLARSVARALSWPLLTITTSDFIVDGEAQVEARAKKLFEALKSQRNIVVFFDEIDRLVLDRDTQDYERQGDMLQFMTPSMLTKINDLRRAELVIFIVGTNYADRIDSAIKRAGRIDERLLVLPPDLSRREEIICKTLNELGDDRSNNSELVTTAAVAAYWRTIAEIKSATRSSVRLGGDLAEAMSSLVPAISLESYMSRLTKVSRGEGEKPPSELLEEAFMLAYLYMQGREGEPFPRRYDSLADRWATRLPGIIRDSEVEQALEDIFGQSK